MLGKIINHKVVLAKVGAGKVEIAGITLLNPTEQTYLGLGFEELPTANPADGYHIEWRVSTRKATKDVVVRVEYTSALQDGVRMTVPREIRETREVEEEYIEAFEAPDTEETPTVHRYSKYKIQLKAQALGIWEDVKAAIAAAGLADSWSNIVDIASDNGELVAALPSIRAAFPSIDVDAFLAECIAD